MFEPFKKEPDLESDKVTSIPKAKINPQKPETSPTTGQPQQIDYPQFKESSNSINDLDLVASLQKMKTEEQALLEQKQRLLATEQNLHTKLVKEMDKKKTTINALRTEIIDRINRCDKLSQALRELSM
jgi:predicted RNase H-like nuclease (RuvC/YqgF family)